jgi:hypothetical protein
MKNINYFIIITFIFIPLQLSAKSFITYLFKGCLLFDIAEEIVKCPSASEVQKSLINQRKAYDLPNNQYWYIDADNYKFSRYDDLEVNLKVEYAEKRKTMWQCEYQISFLKEYKKTSDYIYLYKRSSNKN